MLRRKIKQRRETVDKIQWAQGNAVGDDVREGKQGQIVWGLTRAPEKCKQFGFYAKWNSQVLNKQTWEIREDTESMK